jgi:hypothetical protein
VVAGGHAQLTAGEAVVFYDGTSVEADGLLTATTDPSAACP